MRQSQVIKSEDEIRQEIESASPGENASAVIDEKRAREAEAQAAYDKSIGKITDVLQT